jgi:alpha-methylacyl-CoA racemase
VCTVPSMFATMSAPLTGLRVVELAGLGPAPHAAMILADHGADVVRIIRPSASLSADGIDHGNLMARGKQTVTLDLKSADGLAAALELIGTADVLIEAMRPGVAERLGVGPADCQARNPRLIYARMTGWGQTGPLAARAGHDINYIAISGVLSLIGRRDEPPAIPVNLLGDFGGGSMFLLFGVLAALYERDRTGVGTVIDAAIVDGASVLAQMVWELIGHGVWTPERGTNLLDGGAPFYDTYTCADGQQVAVGALEPQFYAQLLAGLGLDTAELPPQLDRAGWPALRAAFTAAFLARSRAEWTAVFGEMDACVTPVLTLAEAAAHPHAVERSSFQTIGGTTQPVAAPRFRAQA